MNAISAQPQTLGKHFVPGGVRRDGSASQTISYSVRRICAAQTQARANAERGSVTKQPETVS